MLWTLLKIVVFVAVVAALAFGIGWLVEYDGAGMTLNVNDLEIRFTAVQMVLAALALMLALWVLLKLVSLLIATLRFVNGDETALSRHFERSRERKGVQALSEGLMALASGEGKQALSKATKAEKYLRKPELTNILKAQAAEMSGDKTTAEKVYKSLVKDEKTRFVGLRGVMKQKLENGETDTALKLAERAFSLKPRHEETQDILLKLQAEKGDWSGARKTLNAKLKHGGLPRGVHRRRDAVLALSEARAIADSESTIDQREVAIEANRLSPELIPAAVMAARSYIEQGKGRYATRVIKKAWTAQPHPDLAASFAEIEPDETPAQRLKRFQALFKLMPEHRETRLLKAELHIADEDFPAARRAIGDLVENDPDARVLTIMAAIERGEGSDDAIVKGWLARALDAPRGPQWVCDNCSSVQREWTAVCGNCGALDSLSWTAPAEAESTTPSQAAMLPLIVGAIPDHSSADARSDGEEPDVAAPDAGTETLDAEIVEPGETPEETAPDASAR